MRGERREVRGRLAGGVGACADAVAEREGEGVRVRVIGVIGER